MTYKFFLTLNIIAVLNGFAGFIDCNNSAKSSKRNGETEGYIVFDIKIFKDVDKNGIAVNPLVGNDSIFLFTNRKIYIKNYSVIDILENKQFHNGEYIRTDTSSYSLYDLTNQKCIIFDKLSADARIIKKGSMETDGAFSKMAKYDPMNGIVDSIWKQVDTVINGKKLGVVNFFVKGVTDTLYNEFVRRTKFWVDHETKNFPLQLSHILSQKLDGSFVYKWQGVFPDGKMVMVTSLDYQPAKLPDTLIRIFERWTQIARE